MDNMDKSRKEMSLVLASANISKDKNEKVHSTDHKKNGQ